MVPIFNDAPTYDEEENYDDKDDQGDEIFAIPEENESDVRLKNFDQIE